MMELQQGQTILGGKYRIERLLGRGAFGEAYLATHLRLGVQRAVKVLRRDAPGVGSQEFAICRDRFAFEAQLGARLDDPHVVKVHDFEPADGELYLVMEYCARGSLADRLAQNGPLPVADVVELGLDLCDGLATIHENLPAVHRDIKPSNILFDADGRAKIGDLGLAQAPGSDSRSNLLGSLAGAHPGTPPYMSPEQETTRGYLLPTSDIFSLGCVLFEALTGKVYKTVYGAELREQRGDVPEWLATVVARALQETPGRMPADEGDLNKRYRRAAQMRADLAQGSALLQEAERKTAEETRQLELRRKEHETEQARLHEAEEQRGAEAAAEVDAEATRQAELRRREQADEQLRLRLEDTLRQVETRIETETAERTPRAEETPLRIAHGAVVAEVVGWDPEPRVEEAARQQPIWQRIGIELIKIPAGEFLYGDDKRKITLPEYWIAKTPVTNAQYKVFVEATGYRMPNHWQDDQIPLHKEDHPVVKVSWVDASDFCAWAGLRLPTDQEWEKAARGVDGREYPWGNWQLGYCNSSEAQLSDTTVVGRFPNGASPYGALDMSGNVWEWCADADNTISCLLKGGSYGYGRWDARCAGRIRLVPDGRDADVGFRVASPEKPQDSTHETVASEVSATDHINPQNYLSASYGIGQGSGRQTDSRSQGPADSVSPSGKSQILRLASGRWIEWPLQFGWILNLQFMDNDRLLAMARDGMDMYSLSDRRRIWWSQFPEALSRALHPSGTTMVSGHAGGEIAVWDVTTKRQVTALSGHRSDVKDVAFSPAGNMLASAGWDAVVQIWGTSDWYPIYRLEPKIRGNRGAQWLKVKFSPDGRMIAALSPQGVVQIWDTSNGQEMARLSHSILEQSNFAFNSSGSMMAVVTFPGRVFVWDLVQKRIIWEFESWKLKSSGRDLMKDVAFAAGEHILALPLGGDGISVMDVLEQRVILSLRVDPKTRGGTTLTTVACAPGGRALAAGSDAGSVFIWSRANGEGLS